MVVITALATFTVSALLFIGWSHFKPNSIIFDTRTVSANNIRKFNKVRNLLKSEYYGEVDENKLLEGAIAGMVEALGDPYTAYYNKEEWQMLQEEVGGNYVGIGVVITTDEDGLITVVEIFKNSPAEKAGIKAGDKIIRVDGKDVKNLSEDMVIKMIRGKENTKVAITLFRPSEEKTIELELTRQLVDIENIESRKLEQDIGYIRIIKFDTDIARDFKGHLNELMDRGIKGLIIDVRDNPGGLYDEVVEIADRLLPEGIIVYTEDKYGQKEVEYSDKDYLDMPLVLLINEYSASASEILAGAIRDHQRGTLVGVKTFGKGLVQEPISLGDGSGLKITVQKYFTPAGYCIHGKGIEPDIAVDAGEKYKNVSVSRIPIEEDRQLIRAVEVLKRQLK